LIEFSRLARADGEVENARPDTSVVIVGHIAAALPDLQPTMAALRRKIPRPIKGMFHVQAVSGPSVGIICRQELADGGKTMRKHTPFASTVIRNVFAATLITSAVWTTSHMAVAADGCLTRPDLRAEQGGHWYYRVDRVSHRHCWYQQASAPEIRDTRPPTAIQNPTPVASANPVTSLLTAISAIVTGTTSSTPAQDAAVRTSRFVEATSERSWKRRSRAAKRAEPDKRGEPYTRAEPEQPDNSFASRYSNLNGAQSTTVAEESRAVPSSSHAWPQAQERPPLDAVTREALFQEFLRWQERRSNVVW
jgi:hypothetical protein